jgi:hypothetical protein
MRAAPVDYTGQVFGRLTVVRCECGTTHVTVAGSLRNGYTTSCGCWRRERRPNLTHGLTDSPEYRSWCHMKERCSKQGTKDYANYGGRGVTVCGRWRDNFEAFYADMGPRPSLQHSIERRDNAGDYEPQNCYWATRTQQNRNRRGVHRITVNGVTRTRPEWAEACGLRDHRVIDTRLRRGWSIERAVTTPPRQWPAR